MTVIWAALVAARLVHFTALMMLFGAVLFDLAVDRPLETIAGSVHRLSAFSTRIRIFAALLVLSSGSAWVTCSLIDMAGGVDQLTWALWSDFFLQTSFGPPWIAHLALCMALVGLAWGRSMAHLMVSTMALVSLAWVGHAAAALGSMLPVRLALQALHLLAAGAWLGALPALISVLRMGQVTRSQAALVGFSTIGIAAVITLGITGLANAALILSAPSDLIATGYGRVLVLKIVLVTGMLGLAAINKFILTPRLAGQEQPATVAKLIRTIGCEQSLGVLVVLAASVLGTSSPVS